MDDNIYLFTSNARPLYVRDAETVAGLPDGVIFRFRYRETYVQTGLRQDWANDTLRDTSALVVFSVQHKHHFHPAAFAPLRHATIDRTWVEGSIYLVEFKLGPLAPLTSDDDNDGSSIRRFTEALRNLLVHDHPDNGTSAARAPELQDVWPDSPEGNQSPAKDWERVVSTLALSGAFPGHRFYRVTGVFGSGDKPVAPEHGRFPMTSGRAYTLKISHYQMDEIDTTEWLSISTDEDVLEVVSSSRFSIASKYDSVTVMVRAKDATETLQGKISIGPDSAGGGPTLELEVEVSSAQGKRAIGTAASATGGVLLALPGLVDDIRPWPWGVLVVVVGVAIIAGLSWFGLSPFNAS